jgi:hypothetical protein
MANSFELIERIIPREYATAFTALFEETDLQFKSEQLKKFDTQRENSVETLIKDILVDRPAYYSDWTKSCILYTFKETSILLNELVIERYLNSEDPIIKEIAEKIISFKKAAQHG